jgi:hypothetical protein
MTSAGQVIWRMPVAAHPRYVSSYQLAQRGSDVIMAWYSNEGLGIAKITP